MRKEEVIQQYLLSAKSHQQREKQRIYTFFVHPKANKSQIKLAIEEIFPKVKVKKIRTNRQKPVLQKVSFLRKFPGVLKTELKKKAFVQLHPGYQLDNY